MNAAQAPLICEQLPDLVRRLGTPLEPVNGPIGVDRDLGGLGPGLVVPDGLDDPAVTRASLVGNHHAI